MFLILRDMDRRGSELTQFNLYLLMGVLRHDSREGVTLVNLAERKN